MTIPKKIKGLPLRKKALKFSVSKQVKKAAMAKNDFNATKNRQKNKEELYGEFPNNPLHINAILDKINNIHF